MAYKYPKVNLTSEVTGTLPVANGGTGDTTLTDHGVLIGRGTAAVDITAAGTSGQVLQSGGASANPAYSTATYPSTATQGDIIYASAANTISGLAKNASATRSLTNTGTSNAPAWAQVALATGVSGTLPVANGGTGVASQNAYSLVAGGTTTTNPFQAIDAVATGQVLTSTGTGSLPAFSATPAVTSITLSGGTALSTYVEGTWVPVITNQTTPPTITYTTQIGNYIKIGKIVYVECLVLINTYTAGTGQILITQLPFTVSATNTFPCTAIVVDGVTFTGTYLVGQFQASQTYLEITQCATAAASGQLVGTALAAGSKVTFSGCYQST